MAFIWRADERPRISWVYMLKLDSNKHYYIGSTYDLERRLYQHSYEHTSQSIIAHGWHKHQLMWAYACTSRKAAYETELAMSDTYRSLFPDIPICGDVYPFGSRGQDQMIMDGQIPLWCQD